MKNKYELDCDYFNRAGDKVKYVGQDAAGWHYFRATEGHLFRIQHDGRRANPYAKLSQDVIGKWEITDDPDRIYIIDGKKHQLKPDNIFTYSLKENWLAKVEKILIEPREKDWKVSWSKAIDRMANPYKPNKIEPLILGSAVVDFYEKINEIANIVNKITERLPKLPVN